MSAKRGPRSRRDDRGVEHPLELTLGHAVVRGRDRGVECGLGDPERLDQPLVLGGHLDHPDAPQQVGGGSEGGVGKALAEALDQAAVDAALVDADRAAAQALVLDRRHHRVDDAPGRLEGGDPRLVVGQLDAVGRDAEERAPCECVLDRRVRQQRQICLAHRGDDRPGGDVVGGHDDVGLAHQREDLVGDVPDAAEVERVLERRRDEPVEAFGGEQVAGPLGVDERRCRRLCLFGGDAHVLSPWAWASMGSATSRL